MKPLGTSQLLEERFDGIFRRNLLAPEAKEGDDRKRNKKAYFKYHKSKAEKDQTVKMAEENQKRRDENKKKGMGKDKMMKSDLILI